ncbi:MAG: hypothetical protein WA674_17100 [Candidatus Acidiferrales bacterium]
MARRHLSPKVDDLALVSSAMKAGLQSSLQPYSGGPWILIAVTGEDAYASINGSLAFSTLYPTAFPPLYLTTMIPGIPAFGGSISSGDSPWWMFTSFNGSHVLAALVSSNAGLALATFTSGNYPSSALYNAISLEGLVDSTSAVAAAYASNSSYFTSNPHLNATFSLVRSLNNAVPPVLTESWNAVFTTCEPIPGLHLNGGKVTNGTAYYDDVNATSGAAAAGTGVSGHIFT